MNKPLGLSPAHIEFKRAHLYDINPVGVGAMVLAVTLGLIAYGGALGIVAEAFSPFLGFFGAFFTAPLIAWATGGRFYLARKPRAHWSKLSTLQCVICENDFEPEDMAFCPVYSGSICSLCCSLDARCGDGCKPEARLSYQLVAPIQAVLRKPVNDRLTGSVGRFFLLLSLFIAVIGTTLALIYRAILPMAADSGALASAFWMAVFPVVADRRRHRLAARPRPAKPHRRGEGEPAANRGCCWRKSTPISGLTPSYRKPRRRRRRQISRKAAMWSASAMNCAVR